MKRSDTYRYMLMAVAFLGITATAVLTGSDVYRIVPLYVSLLVMYLQTQPKQWTYLIYSTYALVCGIISAVYMHKLYNQQKLSI